MNPTQDIIYLRDNAGALHGRLLEHDPCVAETTLGEWNLYMRPEGGAVFKLEREILKTERLLVSFDRYRTPASVLGMTNSSQVLLAIPLNLVQGSICYRSPLAEDSLLLGRDKLIECQMHRGQRVLVVLFDMTLVDAFASEEDLSLLSPDYNEWLFSAEPEMLSHTANAFIDLLTLTRAPATSGRMDATHVERLAGQILLNLIIALRERHQTHSVDSRSRLRVFRRAIEYLNARPDNWRPDIAKIAAVCATSQRSLEYAFREVAGCTARSFVRETKLRTLRRHLLSDQPPRSVQDTAMDLGIFELGRMAGYYRSLFGELPRETVKRNPACGKGNKPLSRSPSSHSA